MDETLQGLLTRLSLEILNRNIEILNQPVLTRAEGFR
jgi:hypothetical protein